MPGENAVGITLFNASHHFVKDRPTRRLGRLLLDEDIDDIEIVASDKLADFGKLVVDAADLPILVVGGLAGIDEKAGG
jgi:hypothetical protein